jgi:chromosome segregation ATPase
MKLKKLLLVAVVVGGGIIAFKSSSSMIRHLKDEGRTAISWVESQVPMEKKFAQLRHEAEGIDKDMEKVKGDLAREIVEVRELTARTAELRASVDTEGKRLTAMGETITDAREKVKYGATMVSVPEATAKLQKDVAVFVRNKKSLDLMENTLTYREKIKETLQKTLDSMKTKKAEVLAAIDEAEAEYKEMQLSNVESKYQADDTKLAKIKENLRKLKKGIEIEKEKLNLSPRVYEETPTAAPKTISEILAPVTGKAPKGNDNIDEVK